MKIISTALILILLLAGSTAREPKPGDYIRVTILGGSTFYGTVDSMDQSLLILNVSAVNDEKPALYKTLNLFGGSDSRSLMPKFAPNKLDRPINLGFGTGVITELAWVPENMSWLNPGRVFETYNYTLSKPLN